MNNIGVETRAQYSIPTVQAQNRFGHIWRLLGHRPNADDGQRNSIITVGLRFVLNKYKQIMPADHCDNIRIKYIYIYYYKILERKKKKKETIPLDCRNVALELYLIFLRRP